jgi:transposase
MRAGRFSEEQIIGILREHEAGAKTPELCRRHGSRTRPSTSMDGSPVARRFWILGGDRLQTSIRRHRLMARPNGISAHTRLDKWSASRAIVKVRV